MHPERITQSLSEIDALTNALKTRNRDKARQLAALHVHNAWHSCSQAPEGTTVTWTVDRIVSPARYLAAKTQLLLSQSFWDRYQAEGD